MPVITGRHAFLEVLHQEGVEYIFGNPGTTELPLMDALVDRPDSNTSWRSRNLPRLAWRMAMRRPRARSVCSICMSVQGSATPWGCCTTVGG